MFSNKSEKPGIARAPPRLLTILAACVLSFVVWRASFGELPLVKRPGRRPLRLTHTSSFKIAIFSDLHYGEDEDSFGIEQDIKSEALMRHVLDKERPDFVILNGDLITGENTFAFNASRYLEKIVGPLVDGGYPWASTYGNHDSKYNLSRESILAEESRYKGSYTQHGIPDTDGVTNYVIPIYPSSSSTIGYSRSWLASLPCASPENPAALLWFFDSRGGATYQKSPPNVDDIPNHVSEATATWFHAKSTSLKRKWGTLPSLAFVHIPMRAFLDLQSQSDPTVHGPYYPGMNADVPLAQQGYSNTGAESISFMRALLETEGLHSVYSGHDHGDSWCGRWPESTFAEFGGHRPFLCFCKHSGFGGYGTWNRGVRVVQMTFQGDRQAELAIDSWVRMEDGGTVTAVSLNSTYGSDKYDDEDGGYHPPQDSVHRDSQCEEFGDATCA